MIATALVIAMNTFVVPEAWVDAVEQIESGGESVYGDNGYAAGSFQFHYDCWNECSWLRDKTGLPVYSYDEAMDKVKSREYARTWLSHIYLVLSKKYKRPATLGEVWIAYNLGMTGFSKYKYSINHVRGWRKKKAVYLNNL